MESPIQNRIGTVFVPVSDIASAIAWYSRILGLPPGQTTHEGRIYSVPMAGDVGLILDAHRPVANSSQPICFFWTDDIRRAAAFLEAQGVEVVSPVADIGSVSTLTFRDPDQNLLMICQANRR